MKTLSITSAVLSICGTYAFMAPSQNAAHSISSTLYMAEEAFEVAVTLPGKEQLTAQMKFPRIEEVTILNNIYLQLSRLSDIFTYLSLVFSSLQQSCA